MNQVIKCIIGVFILWCSLLQAEIRIEITQGVSSGQPIAIVPFKWTGSGTPAQNVGEIVTADLRNSGKFNPIEVFKMPQMPTTPSEVTPQVWSSLGISIVVVGQVQMANDGGYLVSYQLVDVSSGVVNVLSQNQYKVTAQWLRYAAHTISDETFEKVLGIKGAFRTRIAYIVKGNNKKFTHELRVADYDGHNQFVVHRSPEPLMSPAWSADGNKIAYVTFENGRSELVMQTLSTGKVERIASFPRHNGAPAFSPDGTKLAFVLSKDGSLNLYVMDLATRHVQQVTQGRSNNTEPSWFPDSQHIAYTSDQAGRPQVYKININGGAPQRLTFEGSQSQNADVSPDGRFMVAVTTINRKQNLVKHDFESNGIQVLTNTFLDETPSMAPNGTMIIYSATQGLGSVLQLVSTDGRFKASIPATDGQVKFPAWSPYLK